MKNTHCRSDLFYSGFLPKRAVFEAPEAPKAQPQQAPLEAPKESVKLLNSLAAPAGVPISPGEDKEKNKDSNKNVYSLFDPDTKLPDSSEVRVSVPHFSTWLDYPKVQRKTPLTNLADQVRNFPVGGTPDQQQSAKKMLNDLASDGEILKVVEQYEILDPKTKMPLNYMQLAQERAWEQRLPAIYKIKHEAPPQNMPNGLEIPEGKKAYVFGGDHHAKGIQENLANQYGKEKVEFKPVNKIKDLNDRVQEFANLSPDEKRKIEGSTATIIFDPDLFFEPGVDYQALRGALEKACGTLKNDLKMKVVVAAVPPIGDYYVQQYDTQRKGQLSRPEEEAFHNRTKDARETRVQINEWMRKTQMAGGVVDGVMDLDFHFANPRLGTLLWPDLRDTGAYLNTKGLEFATRIVAGGVNSVNGTPKEATQNVAEAPREFLSPKGMLSLEQKPAAERFRHLVQLVQDMRAGQESDKPLFQAEYMKELDWARGVGFSDEDIQRLVGAPDRMTPIFLQEYAEKWVSIAEGNHETLFEEQAKKAISEANVLGADPEKIKGLLARMKKVSESAAK